jgi:catechol 2,3-dioxygenase-like lactoylglutathione lyase family enzyme
MSNVDLPRRGTSHHGLATRDADGTINFYEGVLGFPLVFQNVENGTGRRRKGQRHMFFDLGLDEFFTLFEEDPWEGPGPDPLQVSSGLCYFSFKAGSDWTLEHRRQQLIAAGVPVSEVVSVSTRYPDGTEAELAHKIYFRDPVNGFQCDFTYWVRDFTERDRDVEMIYSADVAAFFGTKQAVNA